MVFGIVGPALVILHSNFNLGSLNSQVALFSMLFVAGSGFIGRFLYKRIYRGMSGRKRDAAQMRADATEMWPLLLSHADHAERIETKLHDFEGRYLKENPSLVSTVVRRFTAPGAVRRLKRELHDHLSFSGASDRANLNAGIESYFRAVQRAQRFVLYERMFALWHLLHLPLFLVLFAAAILHIVAVHLF